MRRQEALGSQVKEALKPLQDNAEPTAQEKAARAAQLRPLAERQEAIARLAAAIVLSSPDDVRLRFEEGPGCRRSP